MKRILSVILAIVLLFAVSATSVVISAENTTKNYIDNSDVTPKYVDDKDVVMEDSGGGLLSLDWVKDLIIVEMQIGHATPEGTFEAAIPLLDHYQETGVNAIWLTPIYDDDDDSNYGNFGIHTISKAMTGCDNYEDGFAVFKNFVDEAHSRNIRIILDVVTWGCDWEAPMYNSGEYPSDWFAGENYWGGWTYNWSNTDFYNYFVDTLVWWTTEMGVDGFRGDCEPSYTGYTMFKDVRTKALEAGEKIVIYSENTNERINGCYDFDEHSAGRDQWQIYELFTELYNIVDYVKNGTGVGTEYFQLTDEAGRSRYYSYLMSCHDCNYYGMKGNVGLTAYQALFSPFIPIFFMGEEFAYDGTLGPILYSTNLDWSVIDDKDNREFFENFKYMIRLRRLYSDLLTEFPNSLRDTNMAEVEVLGLETIQGYVRYNDEYGIMVVANNNQHGNTSFTCRVPYQDMGWENAKYEITDLWTNEVIAEGTQRSLYDFDVQIEKDFAGIYLIKKVGTTTEAGVTRVDIDSIINDNDDSDLTDNSDNNSSSSTDNNTDNKNDKPSTDSDNTSDESVDEDDNDGKVNKKPSKKKKTTSKVIYEVDYGVIIASVIAAVVVIAGIVVLIVVRKKKQSK
ncbi:MAG: hypothetical protein E7521_01385 [Ruminococcaceae bacterium]|nr:hypothetical protein [Oscillospiraceae bacterium]